MLIGRKFRRSHFSYSSACEKRVPINDSFSSYYDELYAYVASGWAWLRGRGSAWWSGLHKHIGLWSLRFLLVMAAPGSWYLYRDARKS